MLPPLGIDEERALYPVILAGRRASVEMAEGAVQDPARRRELQRARQLGQEAESTLLRATFGLVRARVIERGYRFDSEDLEAAGVEGLVNALRRFDPDKGARFSTYANYWIAKMVNQAVQQQVGLTDTEMRHVLRLQKLERTRPERRWTKREVARELGVSQAKAAEIMQLASELSTRRFASLEFDDVADPRATGRDDEPPAWVIEELRRLTGSDFDAFWQFTFRTMPLEEIARAEGISRQALAKRIERSRRAVRESPEAPRLLAWLDQQ